MGETPRYSDRFFGTAGPTTLEGTTHRVGGADEVDVADAGPIDVHDGPGSLSRFERWRAPLAIGLTFAVGAAGGAYGWDRWSDHVATAAAQSAVEVSSAVTSGATLTSGAQVSVEFVNNGSYDVQISEPKFLDAAITTSAVEPFSVPAGTKATQVLPVTVDCQVVGNGADWRPIGGLRAVVTTADGKDHRVSIAGDSDDQGNLASIGADCRDADQPPELYLSTSSVSVSDANGGIGGDGTTDGGGGLVVESHLVLGDAYSFGGPVQVGPDTPRVMLDSVQAGFRGAFTIVTDPVLPAVLAPGDEISVTWQLGTCDQATEATVDDMTLSFTDHAVTSDRAPVGSITADVPVDLGIALAQLAAQHCG